MTIKFIFRLILLLIFSVLGYENAKTMPRDSFSIFEELTDSRADMRLFDFHTIGYDRTASAKFRYERNENHNYYWMEAEDLVPENAVVGSWDYRRTWAKDRNALPNASNGSSLTRPLERNVSLLSTNISGIKKGEYNLFIRIGTFQPWGEQRIKIILNGKLFEVKTDPKDIVLNNSFSWIKVNTQLLTIDSELQLTLSNDSIFQGNVILDSFLLTDNENYVPAKKLPNTGYYSVMPYKGPGITADFWHPARLNTPVYVCKASSQHFLMDIRNLSGEVQSNFDVVITLPEGVEIINPSREQRWEGGSGKWQRPYFAYPSPDSFTAERIILEGKVFNRFKLQFRQPIDVFNIYSKLSSLVFVTIKADMIAVGSYPIQIEVHDLNKGFRSSINKQVLEILPELNAKGTDGYQWGVDAVYASFLSHKEQSDIIKTFESAGINLWASRVRANDSLLSSRNQKHWLNVKEKASKMKIANWSEFWWPGTPYNDVSLAYVKKNPEAIGVGLDDDRGLSLLGKLICPQYLLVDPDENYMRPYLKNLVGLLEKRGITEMVDDVEYSSPLSYCFCDRCKKRFSIEYKISWTKLKEMDGESLLQKYRKDWILFRTKQNTELLDKISRIIKEYYPAIRIYLFCGYQSLNVLERYGVDWSQLIQLKYVDGVYVGGGMPGTADQLVEMKLLAEKNNKQFISMANATLSFPTGYDELGRTDQSYLEARVVHDLLSGSKGLFVWWWGTLDGRCMKAFETGTRIVREYKDLLEKGKLNYYEIGKTKDFYLLSLIDEKGKLVSLTNPSSFTEDKVSDVTRVMKEFKNTKDPIIDVLNGDLVSKEQIEKQVSKVFKSGDVKLWYIPTPSR